LRRYGLLLESDQRLPSVVSLVAGKAIAGSWWGHPSGAAIYHESHRLADRPDVVLLKLLNRKVTYVHRPLWPQVYAVGRCNEPWQVSSLSRAAQKLLDLVRRQGSIRTDDPRSRLAAGSRMAPTALELERRLLVVGAQIHTETGRHTKTLESWSHWARRVGLRSRMSVATARAELEQRVERVNAQFDAKARLPWQQ
jgi:hypothetical protein